MTKIKRLNDYHDFLLIWNFREYWFVTQKK